jgi:hypothetical protein
MLMDMNLITPIRQTNSDLEAKRRRQEKDKAQRVLPRREGEPPPDQGNPGRSKGKSLSAYV